MEFRKAKFLIFLIILLISQLIACTENSVDYLQNAMDMIDEKEIEAHVKFLSDDLLEGRAPGSRGGVLAAKYIATQLEIAGLEPGVDGTWFQSFPMVGVKANDGMELSIRRGDKGIWLDFYDEFVAETGTQKSLVNVNAEMIYVGYGIQAPEYNWDDYKDVDVSDKVLLMLVNDPPSDDIGFFGGKGLTYYGRWTYKYEKAAEMGAAGVILIHTDESAGYGWNVVKNSWSGEQYALKVTKEKPELSLRAWVSHDAAQKFLDLAGLDFDDLHARAADAGFRPINLGLDVGITIRSTIRSVETSNIIGLIPGSDPSFKDEFIIWTGHYDHLGIGAPSPDEADSIYNGAWDNGTGVSAILNMAKAMKSLQPSLNRSILVILTAAEESGLIGASYYAANPVYPLAASKALFNIDALNIWGKTSDLTPLGYKRSTMGEILDRVAARQNLTLFPDQEPEKGYFFRSDHFPFAKRGVPAVSMKTGHKYIGRDSAWVAENVGGWRDRNYHQPSDEIDSSWDFSGIVQIARFIIESSYELANQSQSPEWYDGQEFKAVREKTNAIQEAI